MTKAKTIARVIDCNGNNVTLLMGDKHQTVTWTAAAPKTGEVYEVNLTPSFEVVRKLCAPENDNVVLNDALRWRRPDANGRTRMEVLYQRHLIKRAVRDYLHEQGFIEVDMPLLVKGTTPDGEIETFAVDDRYLVTSTEYQIKRMEIGGFDKTYTLTQNFRLGDKSPTNNPEFTMLEWARVGETLTDIETDLEQFLIRAHKALGGTGKLTFNGHTIDLSTPFQRITVREAIEKVTGVMIEDFSKESLLKALAAANIEIRDDWKNDVVMLYTVLVYEAQKNLGFERPVFLQEWPSFMTSSTQETRLGGFTERTELFIAGVEISNGFPTLTSLKNQITGFQKQIDRRKETDKVSVELDQKYLKSMEEGIPAGAGMALGFDRLVMVLTDQQFIKNVMAFDWDEL